MQRKVLVDVHHQARGDQRRPAPPCDKDLAIFTGSTLRTSRELSILLYRVKLVRCDPTLLLRSSSTFYSRLSLFPRTAVSHFAIVGSRQLFFPGWITCLVSTLSVP